MVVVEAGEWWLTGALVERDALQVGAVPARSLPAILPPVIHSDSAPPLHAALAAAAATCPTTPHTNPGWPQGDEVRGIVERLADGGDLQRRREELERLAFL